MPSFKSIGAALAFTVMGAGFAQAATGVECPVPQLEPANAAAVTKLLPNLESFRDPAKVSAAIDLLKNEGDSVISVVNGLIGSYCPLVAAEPGTTDAQKTADVQHFGLKVTRQAFSISSEEQIILDIALTPDTVDKITAKAKAENISPEQWVANKITADLAQ